MPSYTTESRNAQGSFNKPSLALKAKRICIPIGFDVYVRNFIDSGAFDALIQNHDVQFMFSAQVKKSINGGRCHVVLDSKTKERTNIRWRNQFITMKRYANRSATFPLKYQELLYRHLSGWNKLRFNTASLPGVAEAYLALVEQRLGVPAEIERILEDIKPDLLIVPSGFVESFPIDCIKAARRCKIKTLMLMGNWDNVSSKGVLTVMPDYLGVWGEQTKEKAQRIHRFTDKQIFILGSPQFEIYFHQPDMERDAFRHLNHLPLDKKVILYAGTSRYVDEIAILSKLEQAIEQGILPPMHILYRPHPWKEVYPGEQSFFDCAFKHITMDQQMKDHYIRLLKDAEYKKSGKQAFTPDYRYYPSLFHAVDAVISPLTTMGVEAMLAGKPVMIQAFNDARHSFSAGDMIHFEHHDCWERMNSVLICCSENDLFRQICELLKHAKDSAWSKLVKDDIRRVVYYDQQSYTERLFECVNTILKEG